MSGQESSRPWSAREFTDPDPTYWPATPIIKETPEGITAYFVPPDWLVAEYERYALTSASVMFVPWGERAQLTRGQRLGKKIRSRWYDMRHWLAQKICYISEDLN